MAAEEAASADATEDAEAAVPTTLERAISATGSGRLPSQTLVWVLAASDLLLGTDEEPNGTLEDLRPLVVAAEGRDLLAVFTRPEFAGGYPDQARYLVAMPGIDVLGLLPDAMGLVVNPGHDLGFELPPEGALQIQQELGLRGASA